MPSKQSPAPARPAQSSTPPIRDQKALLEGYREEKRSYEARIERLADDPELDEKAQAKQRARLERRVADVDAAIAGVTDAIKNRHKAELAKLEDELGGTEGA